MFVQPRKNLFEKMRILQEAPGDDANDIMNTNVDQTTTNTDPNAGEAESSQDDDFNMNVDLNLDDPGTGGDADNNTDAGNATDDTAGGDDFGGGEDTTTDTTTDAGSSDNNTEEVKKGNTDLFASLTAEEQAIKIMELKRLYNELYTSTDDLISKLGDNTLENLDPRILVRITSQMEELRRIIQDYIINVFDNKTYYENDVQYSIFLSMFTTIRGVFDDIAKYNDQNQQKK